MMTATNPNSSLSAMEENMTLPLVSGSNVVIQSAFLRMILVATSTVVSVTAIALFAIGISEIGERNDDKNEPMVLAVAGALLLVTSVVQFVTVCVWSGWCSVLPARGFRRLRRNQILVNGQLITVHPTAATSAADLEPTFQITAEMENPMILDPGPPLDTSSVKGSSPHPLVHHHHPPRPDNLDPPPPPTKIDATTSTRGELVFLSPRGNYAPIALQEEITPSLRSSFQSFDELA